MNARQFEQVAEATMAYGEPLVADEDYVEPLYTAARECAEQGAFAFDTTGDTEAIDLDAAKRTAAALLVLTYGADYLTHKAGV